MELQIADTARAFGAAGVNAARALPVAGRVFGPRLDLNGRVVFITGAARGIGAEVARQAHDTRRARRAGRPEAETVAAVGRRAR